MSINSKNINNVELGKRKFCDFCNRAFDNLKQIDNCCHYICNNCCFEKLFCEKITEFQGQNNIIINCKCAKGSLNLKLNE